MKASQGNLPSHPVRAGATLLLAALALLALSCAPRTAVGGPQPAAAPPRGNVGVLASASSFRISSWLGRWESEGGIAALQQLGLQVRVLSDEDVSNGRFEGLDLLVVPNMRCVPRAARDRVDAFVKQGGRLLATGMAAYRDEDNKRVGSVNTFQWSDLYGADFQRWISGYPRCEYLVLDAALASETSAILGRKAPLTHLQLGRNTAMLVAARPDATVLATWLDADRKTPTTDSGGTSAAIVQRERVVYAGENLLAPELSRSREVQALMVALLRRLDSGPGFGARMPAIAKGAAATFHFPKPPKTVAVPRAGDSMRVQVHPGIDSLGVSARGGVRVEGLDKALAAGPGEVLEMRAVAPVLGRAYVAVYGKGRLLGRGSGTVTVRPLKPEEPLHFLDLRPNGTCRAQGYRGILEVGLSGQRLSAINVLSIEEYTAGVVPNEVPGSYPLESIKAMSVIARTFALQRRGFHRADGHDVCNTVHCQVYGGWLTEWESSNRAVADTVQEIIEHDGALADSTFHAVCGGVGENVERVWPQGAAPYLVAHADGPAPLPDLSGDSAFRAFIDDPPPAYCSGSPRFRWTEAYGASQLQALFEKSLPVTLGSHYHGLGTLLDVKVLERSPFGRVQVMEIVGTEGTYRVEKDRIRWLWSGGQIGQGGLQSTLFYITKDGDRYVFKGGGWGHGVGMCQDGASGMATRGKTYRDIIRHYYPGTSLANLRRSSHAQSRP